MCTNVQGHECIKA